MPANSEPAPPSFKTVHASVRPGRVAVLVDRSDDHWQDTCLRVIEFFSRMWGGAYNLIVPTDGKTIDERFWTILEAFDPDYLYCYRKSGEDIRLSAADSYQKILDGHIRSYVAQFGQGNAEVLEEITREIDKDLRAASASDFEITSALQNEIKIRLSPFYFQQWIVDSGPVSANSAVSFPLTSLVQIIRNTEHSDRFASLHAPTNLLPQLWYGAVCGALCGAAVKELEAIGITQDRFEFDENDIGQLVEFVMAGEVRGPWVLQPNKRLLADLNGIAPFQLSMLQLGLYRPAKYEHWAEPLVMVIGNAVEDFCFYYCLSRLRERVVWVLPSITEKALSSTSGAALRHEVSFIAQLRNEKYSKRSQGGLAFTSYSLSDKEQTTVVEWLNSQYE